MTRETRDAIRRESASADTCKSIHINYIYENTINSVNSMDNMCVELRTRLTVHRVNTLKGRRKKNLRAPARAPAREANVQESASADTKICKSININSIY